MIFETERLIIRPFIETDIPQIYDYGKHMEVVQYQDWGPVASLDAARAFYTRAITNYKKDPSLQRFYAIELKAAALVIGDTGFFITDAKMEEVGIGYNIHPDYWRKGYGTESTKALVQYIQASFDSISIYAKCNVLNVGSRKVLEKCGFVLEKTETIEKSKVVRTEKNYFFRVPNEVSGRDK